MNNKLPCFFSFFVSLPPTVCKMIRKLGKSFQNIAAQFLWLAVIIIIAHTVIPHDHHAEFSGSIPDSTCNAHENGSGNHHSIPLHCHSLNDLVCEKFTFNFINLHRTSFSYLPISANVVSVTVTQTNRLVSFHDRQFPLAGSEMAVSDPFRAPPFFI
jgi:hypothetical protein